MTTDLRGRVLARLEELDRNPFVAATRAGLERSFINDILIGKKSSVRDNKLEKLAAALDWTTADLLGQTQHPSDRTPNLGMPVRPLIYRDEPRDNDCIQVSVGDLRKVVARALRRADVSEKQALTGANVIIGTLVTQPSALLVVSLKEQDHTPSGSPAQERDDQL